MVQWRCGSGVVVCWRDGSGVVVCEVWKWCGGGLAAVWWCVGGVAVVWWGV